MRERSRAAARARRGSSAEKSPANERVLTSPPPLSSAISMPEHTHERVLQRCALCCPEGAYIYVSVNVRDRGYCQGEEGIVIIG